MEVRWAGGPPCKIHTPILVATTSAFLTEGSRWNAGPPIARLACKGYNEPYYAHAIGDWGARRELGGGSFVQAGRAQERRARRAREHWLL